MPLHQLRSLVLLSSMALVALAVSNIQAPNTIPANSPFQITFSDAGSNPYRVYLAAALVENMNGPTCYLENSTTLTSPLTLTIPADVGPAANYYSIALTPLTSSPTLTFSNTFALTNTTTVYSDYENALAGGQFWDPNALPCTSYACARACATASYPQDLTNATAYNTMKSCILNCPGVAPAPQQTAPAHPSSLPASLAAAQSLAQTYTGLEALLPLTSGVVATALATDIVSGSSTLPAAVIETDSSRITLVSGSVLTLATHTLSLAGSGVAVDASTTVMFSTEILTTTTASASSSVSGNSAAQPTTSQALAARARWEHTGVFLLSSMSTLWLAGLGLVVGGVAVWM